MLLLFRIQLNASDSMQHPLSQVFPTEANDLESIRPAFLQFISSIVFDFDVAVQERPVFHHAGLGKPDRAEEAGTVRKTAKRQTFNRGRQVQMPVKS